MGNTTNTRPKVMLSYRMTNTSPKYEFSAPEMQSYVRTVFLHAVDKSIRQLPYGLCIFESPIIDTAPQLLDVIWQIIICKSRVRMGKINDLVLLQDWRYFIPIVGCLVYIGTIRISGTLQCQKNDHISTSTCGYYSLT